MTGKQYFSIEEAIAHGYQVYVPVDACGGMSARAEEAAFRAIEVAGGVTTSVVFNTNPANIAVDAAILLCIRVSFICSIASATCCNVVLTIF